MIVALLALGASATGPEIDTRYTSDNQNSRVQFIVIHYTEGNFASSLETLTHGDVSSHYLVDVSPPTIYRLVDETRRAWHAGPASWQGHTYINANSVGIEIVNRGPSGSASESGPYEPYGGPQILAVVALVRDIERRHEVRPDRIAGHAEVLPQQKVDPGPLFPWHRLFEAGLVPWPDMDAVMAARPSFERQLPDAHWFQRHLASHGSAIVQTGLFDEQTRRVMQAFQMRYRPARFDGAPDAETAALLDVITRPDGLRLIGADGHEHLWKA